MFFKRQKTAKNAIPFEERPLWDEKTVGFLANSESFDVKVTHVTRRTGYGTARDSHVVTKPNGWEISGILTYPKLIAVDISVESPAQGKFGGWFYETILFASSTRLPKLQIYLTGNQNDALAADIMEALKVSIICRRQSANVRFWKRKGEGIMTAQDKEQGFSRSHYDIFGAYTWSEIQASTLPNWAHPLTLDTDLKNVPESWDMTHFQ